MDFVPVNIKCFWQIKLHNLLKRCKFKCSYDQIWRNWCDVQWWWRRTLSGGSWDKNKAYLLLKHSRTDKTRICICSNIQKDILTRHIKRPRRVFWTRVYGTYVSRVSHQRELGVAAEAAAVPERSRSSSCCHRAGCLGNCPCTHSCGITDLSVCLPLRHYPRVFCTIISDANSIIEDALYVFICASLADGMIEFTVSYLSVQMNVEQKCHCCVNIQWR